MIDQVIADGVEATGLRRDQRLCAYAIRRGYQRRVPHVLNTAVIHHPGKGAHARQDIWPLRRPYGIFHQCFGTFGGGDIYPARNVRSLTR